MDLDYTKSTKKDFDAAVADVEKITAEKGFRVLHIHNVQATLQEKGFERAPLKIVEICNARFAHEALNANIDVGLFMPCKINIYTKDGNTTISAARPSIIGEFFQQKEIQALADNVDSIVRSIVDEAC